MKLVARSRVTLLVRSFRSTFRRMLVVVLLLMLVVVVLLLVLVVSVAVVVLISISVVVLSISVVSVVCARGESVRVEVGGEEATNYC